MMIRTPKKSTTALLLAVLCLALMPMLASAQSDRTRSDTGRHKPQPKPVPKEEKVGQASVVSDSGSPWFVGLGAGFQGGSDLWHIETTSGAAVPWISDVPFTSSRFNASLENNFAMVIFAGRHMGEMWSLRADLNSSRMDIGAEALQGQQGAVFLYDRLTITTLGLAGEVRLARLRSYPYVSAGVIVNRVSAAREKKLDQNQLGLRLGLGYLKEVSPDFSLRAEARFSRSGFDVDTFVPQSSFDNQPEVEFEPVDHLSLFEVILAVQLNLS